MSRLRPITSHDDIPSEHRETPIGRLLEYHNLGRSQQPYAVAQLLIGMCMDNRKNLRIPDNFAFILRAGGANLRDKEFKLSYAIAVGGARSIALIGHSQCGMVNLVDREEKFVKGLVERAGWSSQKAHEHFRRYAPIFEIGNEVDFILKESKRLKKRYPKIPVVPLMYKVEDNRLYLVEEGVAI
ncbi:MAG: hypothetical protein ACD_28C00364G0008 [uncultured bacterium]|nr:MAG: hypothetical protein ACD_28C00364G0008 [uncultured bacterium]